MTGGLPSHTGSKADSVSTILCDHGIRKGQLIEFLVPVAFLATMYDARISATKWLQLLDDGLYATTEVYTVRYLL